MAGTTFLPPTLWVLSDPGVSRNHPKSMKIPRSFQYTKKPKNVARGSPTGVKMTPKITLPTPNRWIGDKSEILQKPLYLIWFKHIQPLNSGIISIPGSPKRWTWKLSPTLTSQITENHPNVPKSCSQEASKMQPKINENWHLALTVSIGCPPGSHDYENGAPGTQNTAWRFPKWQS